MVGDTVGAVGVGPVDATLDVVSNAGEVVVSSAVVVVAGDDEKAPIPVPWEMT